MRFSAAFIPILLYVVALAPATQSGSSEEVLTTVSAIRALSREEAAEGKKVHLLGVVGWRSNSNRPQLIVNDGELGIYVDTALSFDRTLWGGGTVAFSETEPGSLLEIQGFTDPGGYAPVILPTKIRRIGSAPIPQAKRVPLERLISGAEDAQRVEVEGVIQTASGRTKHGMHLLDLMVDGHQCRLEVESGASPAFWAMVDARVRVRGFLTPIYNMRSQAAGLNLKLMGLSDIDVLVPAPADPFTTPAVSIKLLLPFSTRARPFNRIVTQGIVTYSSPGEFFFIQEGATGLRVASSAIVKVAEKVKVAGFVDASNSLASLREGIVERIGLTEEPPAIATTPREVLYPKYRSIWELAAEDDFNGRKIRIQCIIRKLDWDGEQTFVTISLSAGETLFRAYLPVTESVRRTLPQWVEGTEINLTGVCELEFGTASELPERSRISGFSLWLRDQNDITVLNSAPWWTPQRLWIFIGITSAGLVIVLLFSAVLGKESARRGVKLAREISARYDMELRLITRLNERKRVAGDLHDTLEQALTGLSLQLQACELLHLSDSTRSFQHLRLARKFLNRSRGDLHRAIWDLHTTTVEGRTLIRVLRETIELISTDANAAIEIRPTGEEFPLPDLIITNLSFFVQECITNAIKHASPQTICVCINYSSEEVTIVITDDGRGFDLEHAPGQGDGHFGIQGMRERIARIQGRFALSTAIGQGTRVEAVVNMNHIETTNVGGIANVPTESPY